MPNATPIAQRYYPRLSSVVSEQDIPDILGFIKTGVSNLLSKIYYRTSNIAKVQKEIPRFIVYQ